MRPTPPPAIAVLVVVAAQYSDGSLKQLSHPPSSPSSSASTCDSNTCTRPSSGGERLEANAATILIILLCALICAVALNIAIRCSLRHSRRQLETQAQQQQQHVRKPDMQDVEVQLPPSPTLIFSVGMKLAGEETECAICLSEFVEGEGIRVLDKCRHGFHVHCIQKWLSSHSSCPTCRASCLPSLSVSDEESGTTTSNRSSAPGGGVPDSF